MINILQTVEQQQRSGFVPATPDDFFALHLAALLEEPATAKHYADLVNRHSRNTVLALYQRVASEGAPIASAGKRLHELLAGHPHMTASYPSPRLLAVAVMRRAVAAVLFVGTHLEGVRLRHLPSEPAKAEFSTAAFVRAAIAECRCDSAAIESISGQDGAVRNILHKAALEQLSNAAVPVWPIDKTAVTESFAHPSPRTRKEARRIVAGIWPLPNGARPESVLLDALALGLYVQTDRLFTKPA
jgi:hypothetical protein